MNILYIENHLVFANNAIRQFLFDCHVVLVPSLFLAREKLEHDRYDILMIDYDLDDGKGETLVKQLRSSGYGGKIIAVSAHEHKNEILLNTGADDACGKTNFGKIRQILFKPNLKGKTQNNKSFSVEPESEENNVYLNENDEKEKFCQEIGERSFVSHCGYQICKMSIAASKINEDRAEIFTYPNGFVLVVADGAGGISGGERAAEIIIEKTRKITDLMKPLYRKLNWNNELHDFDKAISEDSLAGESTAVVVGIQNGWIDGASVGDSGAWIILDQEINELTLSQIHKPLLGSGSATPVSFSNEFSVGTLLLASDGLLKYGKRERIKEIMLESDLKMVCQKLINLVRLTSGALWDDVSFIICRKNVS